MELPALAARRGLAVQQRVPLRQGLKRGGLVVDRGIALEARRQGLDADLDADPELLDDRLARGSAELFELGLVRPVLDRGLRDARRSLCGGDALDRSDAHGAGSIG